jgi:hypothetical protein
MNVLKRAQFEQGLIPKPQSKDSRHLKISNSKSGSSISIF